MEVGGMNHSADGAQPSSTQEQPTAELVKQLSEQISVLVRDELKLAQLEMTRKGKRAGIGIGMLGGGGLGALYGLGCLIACVIIAISGVLAPWLAALIVGAVLLAVAGVAALIGKGRLQQATPPVPEATVSSVKTDVEQIKERARR
jgi:lipopolysaccharide export LptBFGC system permease protein LptF